MVTSLEAWSASIAYHSDGRLATLRHERSRDLRRPAALKVAAAAGVGIDAGRGESSAGETANLPSPSGDRASLPWRKSGWSRRRDQRRLGP